MKLSKKENALRYVENFLFYGGKRGEIDDATFEIYETIRIVLEDHKQAQPMENLLREMDKYLDTNAQTSIYNSSIFHKQIKDILKGKNDE